MFKVNKKKHKNVIDVVLVFFVINFENVSHLFLVFLFFIFNELSNGCRLSDFIVNITLSWTYSFTTLYKCLSAGLQGHPVPLVLT